MKVKKIITAVLAAALVLGMATAVSAKESTGKTGTISTAETAPFSLDQSQMTEEQKILYEKALSGDGHVLEVGESVVIGSDDEGEITIKCVSSSTIPGGADR